MSLNINSGVSNMMNNMKTSNLYSKNSEMQAMNSLQRTMQSNSADKIKSKLISNEDDNAAAAASESIATPEKRLENIKQQQDQLTVADNSLNTIKDSLMNIKDFATRAADPIVTDAERETFKSAIADELTKIGDSTKEIKSVLPQIKTEGFDVASFSKNGEIDMGALDKSFESAAGASQITSGRLNANKSEIQAYQSFQAASTNTQLPEFDSTQAVLEAKIAMQTQMAQMISQQNNPYNGKNGLKSPILSLLG